ncbi:MAG: putative metal-binding motif-containing protein [Alphaproteobacteria bacterium]|nr:putative metal-binding motif-containing protein [Alphaproteobacteria bacterium]
MDPRRTLLLALPLLTLAACAGGKADDDDDDGGGDGDGGWDLGTDTGIGTDGGDTDGGDTDATDTDGGDTDADTDTDGGDTDGGDTDATDTTDTDTDADSDTDGSTGGDDVDGDGWTVAEGDCDDRDASIHPGKADNTHNGIDNDCDGAIDNAAFCNAYEPLDVTGDTIRRYRTDFFTGEAYTETVEISGWSSSTGRATVNRSLVGGSKGAVQISEDWRCSSGSLLVSGYDLTHPSYGTFDVSFGTTVKRAVTDTDMIDGKRWSATYTASSTTLGMDLWSMDIDYEVQGETTSRVSAGTFDVIELTADYELVDLTGGYVTSRTGTVTYHLAPGLGLVWSEDRSDRDGVIEERELTSYGDDLYPFAPDEIE